MSRSPSSLTPLFEALDEAREGFPQWFAFDATAEDVATVIQRASEGGDARGFVPIAAGDYVRLRGRSVLALRDRALLLIAAPGTPQAVARAALVEAAAGSPRPHVLLAFGPAGGRSEPPPRRWPGAATVAAAGGEDRGSSPAGASPVVREARVAYGVAAARGDVPADVPADAPSDVARHLQRAARGVQLARSGCHAPAERLLRDVLAALARRGAGGPAATTAIALGRLLLDRGRAKDAEAMFAQAAGHAAAGDGEPAALGARIWQASARVDAGQLVAAEALCRAVLAVGGLDGNEHWRARATLVRTLLWQERLDEAAELDLVGQESGSDRGPYVLSTSIRVWLERGDLFQAGQLARTLVTHAEVSGDPLAGVIALTAHLRVVLMTGDLALAGEPMVRLRRAARDARVPLRLARARLLLVDALRRAGRRSEVARELAWLRRMRSVAPGLLRSAIDRRLLDEPPDVPRASWTRIPAAGPAMVAIARDEHDDRAAVSQIMRVTADALRTSRVDLHASDAGPISLLLGAGGGLQTHLGSRVLEAGIGIGPERHAHGWELAVPVRLGSTMLASLGARWPADRTPPEHARDFLELAAAVATARVDAMLAASREEAATSITIPEFVGGSAVIAELRGAVARAAAAPFAVLIEGESGVGKELVARAIHQLGPRRQRRFCDVNCAALPDELLESELFGHARGAFTGAVTERAGLFEDADGGTLFLDEIADLSPRAQAKLLRVVQQQEVRRVGETFSRKIDTRVVAAANRDMRVEVAEGRFRQDLLYRLDVIRIRIPPLRERPDDVAALAGHFWRTAAARVASSATLTHGLLAALARYHWPGNVRELQNVISALAVAAPARGVVRPALLPAVITGAASVRSARLADARAQFERRFIQVALARAGGSRARAARDIGISRQGLLKILARVGGA
jgi:DNA-binding NtrC family response regulator